MGLLDSLKRDKKPAETSKHVETSAESEKATVENDIDIVADIEDVEVVEREVRPRIEHQAVSTPIKTMKDKAPVKHVIGQTKVMAIINQKGGVGQSTTAINWSAALGELGKQGLLVDLEPSR